MERKKEIWIDKNLITITIISFIHISSQWCRETLLRLGRVMTKHFINQGLRCCTLSPLCNDVQIGPDSHFLLRLLNYRCITKRDVPN